MCCGCAKQNHHHDNQYILSASFLKKLAAYYTQEEIDALIPDLTPYYTQAQVDALIPDLTPYYTQAQVDALIPDLTPYYTRAQVDALIPDLTPYYTKAQVDALIPDLTPYYTRAQVDALLKFPVFSAILSTTSNNVTGDGVFYNIPINSPILNPENDFSASTNRFYAPLAGLYSLTMRVYIQGVAPQHTMAIDTIYTSNRVYYANERDLYKVSRPGGYSSSGFTINADMDAGDVAYPQIYVSGGARTISIYGGTVPYTAFSGHLVRRL